MAKDAYCKDHFVQVEKTEENRRDLALIHSDLNHLKGLVIALIIAISGTVVA